MTENQTHEIQALRDEANGLVSHGYPWSAKLLEWAADQLEAAEAENARLRELLKHHMLVAIPIFWTHSRYRAWTCKLCDATGDDREALVHEPDCPFSATPAPPTWTTADVERLAGAMKDALLEFLDGRVREVPKEHWAWRGQQALIPFEPKDKEVLMPFSGSMERKT